MAKTNKKSDPYPEYSSFSAERAEEEFAALQVKRDQLFLPAGLAFDSPQTVAYDAAVNDIIARQRALTARASAAAKETSSSPGRTSTTTVIPTLTPTTTISSGATRVQRGEPAMPNPAEPVVLTGQQDTGKIKAFVDAQLVLRKLKDTPANRALLRKEYKTKTVAGAETSEKPPKADTSQAWLEEFKTDYPAYARWATSEIVDFFGQDTIDVLQKIATTPGGFSKDEKDAMYKGTSYYQTTSKNQQVFDSSTVGAQDDLIKNKVRTIADSYGDLQLSQTDLQDLGRVAARTGLSGIGLDHLVYAKALKLGADTYVSPSSAKLALQGKTADSLRQIFKAYNYNPGDIDKQIASALSGETYLGKVVTEESIRQSAQVAAKSGYSHLADQIDSGLTLEQIAGNYKKYAADILEKDPTQIDMFSGPFVQALSSSGADGKTRQLGLGEWVQKLKSDAAFGYQFTGQANRDATDLGLTLAKAFGKIGG